MNLMSFDAALPVIFMALMGVSMLKIGRASCRERV